MKAFVKTLADGKRLSLLKPPESSMMKSGQVILAPGESIGEHNTGEREEMLIIMDGVGELEVEGNVPMTIFKDCIAYIPPNTKHNVYNNNFDRFLRYIYVVSKGGENEKND